MCLCMCDVRIVLCERTLTSHLSMGAFQFSSDTPAATAGIVWALRRVQWWEFATSAVFSSQILRLLDVPRAKDKLRNIFVKKVLTFFLHVKNLSASFFLIEWSVDAVYIYSESFHYKPHESIHKALLLPHRNCFHTCSEPLNFFGHYPLTLRENTAVWHG